MTLYLARHGRSHGEGLFLGQSDPDLNADGVRQSETLAQGLAEARIERIVSSRLRRAQQTAEIVAARVGAAVEPDARWNEIGYGRWDGLPWSEIERQWPSEARAKLEDWWTVTPEGGEKRASFFARVRSAWKDLQAKGGTVLLVGHAGVNGL
jgi:broad specificity phosphatase PhoE